MSNTKIIFQETLKGKSLGRTLQNIEFAKIAVSGAGIDLGSKSKSASYYRFLKLAEDTNVTFTDLQPREGVIKLDLEERFPMEDNSQDFLILSNVLEHLFAYQTCLNESFRVLKPSGRLIGSVPFLHQVHLDPDDHFRYTESSLLKIFQQAGFKNIEIKPLGYGPFTAAGSMIAPFYRIKLFIFLHYFFSIKIDQILGKLFKNNNRVKKENFPLHYFFICTK